MRLPDFYTRGSVKINEQLRKRDLPSSQSSLPNITALRAEAEKYARALMNNKGGIGANPPLLCSGIPADRVRNVEQFPDCRMLAISVGGSRTHFQGIETRAGLVSLLEPKSGVRTQMPTPGSISQIDSLSIMIDAVSKPATDWLKTIGSVDHIVVSWGFPQVPFTLPRGQGLTGAYAAALTKHHQAVKTNTEDIGSLFRQFLPMSFQDAKITIQNDVILAMQRYLEPKRMARYRKAALMILGTGCNVTTAEPFAIDSAQGDLRLDGSIVPARLTTTQAEGTTTRPYWVNYEIGQTRLEADPDIDNEAIENRGLSGVSWPHRFKDLLTDSLLDGRQLWNKLSLSPLAGSAEGIVAIAQNEQSLEGLRFTDAIRSQIRDLAAMVIEQSAEKAAMLLTAVSLFSGLGLSSRGDLDLLAMEGSLWKIKGYQQRIQETWQQLLSPELQALKQTELPVEFVTLDDYNASVLGPAYLLGHLSD